VFFIFYPSFPFFPILTSLFPITSPEFVTIECVFSPVI